MSVSSREERILGIIETARAKRPRFKDERVTMAHGAGGKATQKALKALVAEAPAAAPKPAAPQAANGAATAEREHTVRVDTRRLDAIVDLVGELVLARNRLKTLRARLRDEDLDRAVTTLDNATARLQGAVMRTRMQPVGKVFSRFPKLARDVARALDKEVDLDLVGAETELDRNLVEALADPLIHLVRNAIDHGIEMPALREATGKPSAMEESMLDFAEEVEPNSRLSCQIRVSDALDGLIVRLPENQH